MPKVSICVPIYNAEKYIEKCVRSLFEQTLDDIEYIFVDDGTPDKSMKILSDLIAEYPNRQSQVRIIYHEKNKGSAAARNSCLSAATGEYIGWCDSDDWVELPMYEEMYLKAITENADIVCCGIWEEYFNKRIEKICSENRDDLQIEAFFSALWNKLIRRDLYIRNNISFYEGVNIWEDLGVTLRLRYFSHKIVGVNKLFYHYNKQNVNSLVSFPKSSWITEKMQCAILLEKFFQEQKKEKEYYLLIQLLKFQSKESLLLEPSLRDITLWKNAYKESNKYIMKYKNFTLNLRLEYWLAMHGLGCFACFLIDIKRKIKRVIIKR